jgi:energy-coupling factor transporter ATP-binding protein EcfA2
MTGHHKWPPASKPSASTAGKVLKAHGSESNWSSIDWPGIGKALEKADKFINRVDKGWISMTKEVETKQAGWAVTKGTYRSIEDIRSSLPPGLYTLDIEDGHKLYTPVTAPADEAVDLPGLPSKYLMDQIKLFWSRSERYQQYHLLQKRGILLYGEPGCGKTSLINLLSRDLINIGGVIFLVDDFATASVCIQHFRSVEPERPIMTLMEDVEGIFKGDQGNREVKAALSLLDGQDQVNNIVHIACPDPDMRILKADLTWVRAGDLKKNEELIAFDEKGSQQKFRTAKVNSAHVIQKKKFKVITTLGEAVVSEKHPFLIRRGMRKPEWRMVEDLKVGNRILSVGLPWETDISHEGGYLAGQFDGEGHLSTAKNQHGSLGFRIGWDQVIGPVSDYVQKLLTDKGFDVRKYNRKPVMGNAGLGVGTNGPHKPMLSLKIGGGKWEILRFLGSIRPIRLLQYPHLRSAWEGNRLCPKYAKVLSVTAVGEGPVIALDTTTHTFIGEGMLQHNTTNQPEDLADRFIKRPGRFDLVIGIHAPKTETREAYLRHVTKDQIPEKKLKELVDKTEGLSLAYLREIASTFLCLDIPVEETLIRLQKNFKLKTLVKSNAKLGFSIGYEERED